MFMEICNVESKVGAYGANWSDKRPADLRDYAIAGLIDFVSDINIRLGVGLKWP